MTSIGLLLPAVLKVNPPLLVQSVLIPFTVLTSPLFQTRVINGSITEGCYEEFAEADREAVEETLQVQ